MNLLLAQDRKMASKNKKRTGWMSVVASNIPALIANAFQFIP